MHVVGVVAADAGAALRHLFRHGFDMTGIAGQAFVSAIELVGSLCIVVKAP